MRILIICVSALLISCSTATETETEVPEIGDEYGGGIVFQSSSQTVYIVAEDDINSDLPLTCFHGGSYSNQSADGYLNTKSMISYCESEETIAYEVWNTTIEGHDDWFIPSEALLEHLYRMKNEAGISYTDTYWTSSCTGSIGNECLEEFIAINESGDKAFYHRDSVISVKPIRIDTLN